MTASESIHPAARIGAVHLTIANLDRSVSFYQERLGLTIHRRADGVAALGSGGPDLLVLSESPGAPAARGTTGLYHFALLVPSRRDLAFSLRLLVDTSTPLQGASDHGVSESLYLADPDGNGIEIYRDRRREEWPHAGGRLQMTVDPLDFDRLLADAEDPAPAVLSPGTVMGHVHLRVAHLPDAERFYADVLGFSVTQRYGPGALFVAAGGYHHHLGLNTWAGVGAPSPPSGAIGLGHFVIELPDQAAVATVAGRLEQAGIPMEAEPDGSVRVHDPSRNTLKIAVSSPRPVR
jgi:catechol 2,3-dioxygenase